jgi:hypothetical protein
MSGLLMSKTGYISLNDPRFNYSYKGFCSIVCEIISIALEHYAEYNNFNVIIDEPQTLQFFDFIHNYYDKEYYDAGPWYLEKFFSNNRKYGKYNPHELANLSDLKMRNKILNSILKIKKEYIEQFEEVYSQLGINNKTLGIQIRGTDKKNELPEINVYTVIKIIDEYLNSGQVNNIFLCTDDKKYLDVLLDKYGEIIIYDKTLTISNNSQSLHHHTSNRTKINQEVLSSVYLLSKCNYFLYSFSNVSFLALIMGIYNFKKIDNLNQ